MFPDRIRDASNSTHPLAIKSCGVQAVSGDDCVRLLFLDYEVCQDRTGCRRTPNAARCKRIQKEGIPDARLTVTRFDFGDETECHKKLLSYFHK